MKDLNKAIGRVVEAFETLSKSIVELAKSLVNILFPALKSNNWRKLEHVDVGFIRSICEFRRHAAYRQQLVVR